MAARAAAERLNVEPSRSRGRDESESSDGGVGLRQYMLGAYKRGELSAVAVCSLSYHATRGGCRGVADLSLHPSSTHHAEHLRKALG
eukprot:2377622-Pyramimonas_sp.AAC.1